MSRNSAEIRRRKEKRGIAATIGYCFVIVLVVLLVMSNTLTDTYTVILQSERAEAMESLAVSCSTALGHSRITEGMTYPLPVYSYDDDKNYIFDIYTKAGNSFLRLCTTSDTNSTEQYYLSGVGDEYNNCFELQHASFTKRTDEGIEYVCAIAPIISSENTVAGILEVRMPYYDYCICHRHSALHCNLNDRLQLGGKNLAGYRGRVPPAHRCPVYLGQSPG